MESLVGQANSVSTKGYQIKVHGDCQVSQVQGHEVVWEATESENTVVPCTLTQGGRSRVSTSFDVRIPY